MKRTLGFFRIAGFGVAFCLVVQVSATLRVSAETNQTWPLVSTVQVGTGYDSPVQVTNAADGSGRLFVVEQPGRIKIMGNTSGTPFLDISDRVLSPSNGGATEQGLLSVAFPPGYSQKGYFYVFYVNLDGNSVLSRFSVTQDPDHATPFCEVQILLFQHPEYDDHYGGQLFFGQDGYLYVSTGDGGGIGDPNGNAQNPDSLLGKLLRIDVEGVAARASSPEAAYLVYLPMIIKPCEGVFSGTYAIPPDNPFVGKTGYRPEIWALGLRNPWRFSFDRLNGDLYIGDVGQSSYEEVDYQPASSSGGENYGWNIMEGMHCYLSTDCNQSGLVLPVAEYTHSEGCAISGGYVYRGSTYPGVQGIYFYGDYCSRSLWGLQKTDTGWENQFLVSVQGSVSGFGEDEQGEVYVTTLSGGIYQVVETP